MDALNTRLESDLRALGVPADLTHGVVPSLPEMPREIVVFSRTTPESARDKGPHMHARHVLCVCVRGAATLAIDGEMVSIEPGEAVLLFPFERHLFHRFQGTDILWAFVGFDLTEFTALEVLRHRVLRLPPPLRERFAELVAGRAEALRTDDALARALIGARLMLLLVEMARIAAASAPPVQTGGNPVVRAVLAEITRRIATPFTLGELAEAVHVSESHLRRTFHAVTGVTLGDFVRRSRVRHAQALLARGELRVGEVARLSGFAGQHAFARTFKALTGVSAKAWRADAGERPTPVGKLSKRQKS